MSSPPLRFLSISQSRPQLHVRGPSLSPASAARLRVCACPAALHGQGSRHAHAPADRRPVPQPRRRPRGPHGAARQGLPQARLRRRHGHRRAAGRVARLPHRRCQPCRRLHQGITFHILLSVPDADLATGPGMPPFLLTLQALERYNDERGLGEGSARRG